MRRGRFFCTPDGKIVIAREGAVAGNTPVFCITTTGNKYDAVTGVLVGRVLKQSTNDSRIAGSGDSLDQMGTYSSNKRRVTIVNNYEEEEKAAPVEKVSGEAVWDRRFGKLSRPFTGFYIGVRGGFGFTDITQSLDLIIRAPTVPVTTSYSSTDTLTQSVGSARVYAMIGANWQMTKHFFMGIDIGGAILSYDAFAIPADSNGSPYVYRLQSSRGIIDAQLRIGGVIANSALLYMGVGGDLYAFKEVNTGNVFTDTSVGFGMHESTNYSIAPKISVGAEWLIKGHFGIRVEYAFTYMLTHKTDAVYTDSSTTTSLQYNTLRHTVSGGVYYKF